MKSMQFDDVSRKAATGSLTAAEREWLEAHLREHPGKRARLDWDAAFSAKLEDKIASMPAMPGWERTARELNAEPAAPRLGRAAVEPGIVSRPGLLDRLSEWLASALGVAINAQAVAVALILMQAGVIGVLAWQYGETDDSQIRAGTQDPALRGPLLRVSFRPDLREAELRRALSDVGGEIVAGPGQIGVYVVRVKEGDLWAAAERLRASGMTELVEIVEPRR